MRLRWHATEFGARTYVFSMLRYRQYVTSSSGIVKGVCSHPQNKKKYSRRRKSGRDGSNQIATLWVVVLQEFYQNPAVSGLL